MNTQRNWNFLPGLRGFVRVPTKLITHKGYETQTQVDLGLNNHSYLLQIEVDTAVRVCTFVFGRHSQNGEAGVPFHGMVYECLRGRAWSLNGMVKIHSHARIFWPFMQGRGEGAFGGLVRRSRARSYYSSPIVMTTSGLGKINFAPKRLNICWVSRKWAKSAEQPCQARAQTTTTTV